MSTFKAIVVEQGGHPARPSRLADFDERELMEGDVTVARRIFDAELQGRARAHRQGAGGAPLSDDRRHRFRRHGAIRPRIPTWKPGDKVILNGWGVGETHLGGYAREGARQGRLAGAAAAEHERRARRWRSARPATRRCWR